MSHAYELRELAAVSVSQRTEADIDRLVELTRNVALLGELPPHLHRGIVPYLRLKIFPPYYTIWKAGDPGYGLYIIVSGTVSLISHTADGTLSPRRLFEGDEFGSECFDPFARILRTTTVQTNERVEVLELVKEQFFSSLRALDSEGLMDKISFLCNLPWFSKWPRSKITELCGFIVAKTFEEGQEIFSAKTPAEEIGILRSGVARAYVGPARNTEAITVGSLPRACRRPTSKDMNMEWELSKQKILQDLGSAPAPSKLAAVQEGKPLEDGMAPKYRTWHQLLSARYKATVDHNSVVYKPKLITLKTKVDPSACRPSTPLVTTTSSSDAVLPQSKKPASLRKLIVTHNFEGSIASPSNPLSNSSRSSLLTSPLPDRTRKAPPSPSQMRRAASFKGYSPSPKDSPSSPNPRKFAASPSPKSPKNPQSTSSLAQTPSTPQHSQSSPSSASASSTTTSTPALALPAVEENAEAEKSGSETSPAHVAHYSPRAKKAIALTPSPTSEVANEKKQDGHAPLRRAVSFVAPPARAGSLLGRKMWGKAKSAVRMMGLFSDLGTSLLQKMEALASLQTVVQMFPGDLIGEVEVLAETDRVMTFVAVKPCTVFMLSKDNFLSHMMSESSVAATISELANRKTVLGSPLRERNLDEFVKYTRDIKFFQDMDANIHRDLCEVMEYYQLDAGYVVAEEGDDGDCMFVVMSGSVKLLNSEGGVFGKISAGAGFGELSILRNEPRMMTIVAAEPLELLRISKMDFDRHLRALGEERFRRRLEVLKESKVLSKHCTADELASFTYFLDSKNIPKGDVIAAQGSQCKHVYIVESGECHITFAATVETEEMCRLQIANKSRQQLAVAKTKKLNVASIFRAGFFGDFESIWRIPFEFSLTAATDAQVFILKASDFTTRLRREVFNHLKQDAELKRSHHKHFVVSWVERQKNIANVRPAVFSNDEQSKVDSTSSERVRVGEMDYELPTLETLKRQQQEADRKFLAAVNSTCDKSEKKMLQAAHMRRLARMFGDSQNPASYQLGERRKHVSEANLLKSSTASTLENFPVMPKKRAPPPETWKFNAARPASAPARRQGKQTTETAATKTSSSSKLHSAFEDRVWTQHVRIVPKAWQETEQTRRRRAIMTRVSTQPHLPK